MIKGLYEAHLQVEQLDRSMDFYSRKTTDRSSPSNPSSAPIKKTPPSYFSDPDGHRLEWICPVPGDAPKELPKIYWSERQHRSSL